ncbi:MAG: 1-deoxy-D-xylulose-5-phosphate reductoisomerase [Caldiserica bacterium]|jgi:1-deoxy-D-xylulose-5-phosphate reductoisomerase|nr:1-deoxy-D-xylulose-5-phosphate reductoisomerase [Caldisericota bacterium]
MKRISILGATGSIGRQALEVVERFPERLELVGVSASRSVEELGKIVLRHHPKAVALTHPASTDPSRANLLGSFLPPGTGLYLGEEGLVELVTREDVDLVLVAVVGIAGLAPTLEALRRGKTVALATKEALVAGGKLVERAIKEGGGRLIPVDSEHSAIFQCLQGESMEAVDKIVLTASGGPFWRRNPAELERVTVEEALAHPVWKMGKKITVDSATLMNKGLEVIEAHYLFGLPPEKIEVLIHPQSVVHSLVRFKDGAMLAQLSVPDMRLPIQYALLYPERLPSLVRTLDLAEVGKLEFQRADLERFPALRLAYLALEMGGTAPTVLSAADEVAVEAFLGGRISFTRIVQVVEEVLSCHVPLSGETLEEVLEADRWARKKIGTVPIFY